MTITKGGVADCFKIRKWSNWCRKEEFANFLKYANKTTDEGPERGLFRLSKRANEAADDDPEREFFLLFQKAHMKELMKIQKEGLADCLGKRKWNSWWRSRKSTFQTVEKRKWNSWGRSRNLILMTVLKCTNKTVDDDPEKKSFQIVAKRKSSSWWRSRKRNLLNVSKNVSDDKISMRRPKSINCTRTNVSLP